MSNLSSYTKRNAFYETLCNMAEEYLLKLIPTLFILTNHQLC
ncbi:MAG: hypothetical protein ACOYMA_16860 [Bacteroidia bacterium]